MTCFEKYRQEHGGEEPDVINLCPNVSGGIDIDTPDYCDDGKSGECMRCWAREIPNTEPIPVIKDSGERREFDSGAVRDIQEGKGRCDLMPLDVLAECYLREFPNNVTGMVFEDLYKFTQNGDVSNLYEALSRREPFDCFSDMFLEVAIHFEEGCKKYGENNWQKGIPVRCYIDSAVRHYLKWLRGDMDEPHKRAFCWNIICAIWTCKHKPELNEYKEN